MLVDVGVWVGGTVVVVIVANLVGEILLVCVCALVRVYMFGRVCVCACV